MADRCRGSKNAPVNITNGYGRKNHICFNISSLHFNQGVAPIFLQEKKTKLFLHLIIMIIVITIFIVLTLKHRRILKGLVTITICMNLWTLVLRR